jgi:hypothetical protein
VVRSTLKRLENTEELASDDPALTELRESIVSNITELEVAKIPKEPAAKRTLPQRILWIRAKAGKSPAENSAPVENPPPAGGDPSAGGG